VHHECLERPPKRLCLTPASSTSGQFATAPKPGATEALLAQRQLTSKTGKDAKSMPSCPRHGNNLALKRVRKQGPNHGRLFFTCRGGECSFFEWADTHFPLCSCAAKKLAILRVSKTERSGGKWFFACRGGDKIAGSTQCKFFAWASDHHLKPLQGFLNPLT